MALRSSAPHALSLSPERSPQKGSSGASSNENVDGDARGLGIGIGGTTLALGMSSCLGCVKDQLSGDCTSTNTMPHPLPARPVHSGHSRSIDDFYNEAYESGTPSSRLHFWLLFLALGIANSGDATEIGCMNYILSHPLFVEEILQAGVADYSGRGAAISSAIFAGMLIGGVVTGALGDRMGRRPTLLAGLFLNATFGIVSSLSPNAWIMCLFRFCAGLGIGAVLSSLITLATELSPSKHRGFFLTTVGGFWTLGSIFIATCAYFLFGQNDYSWRVFILIAASPTFLGGLLVSFFVPESPRYLALHGKYEEATKVCNKIADSMGYRGAPLDVREVRDHFEPVVGRKALTQPPENRFKETRRKIGNLYQKDLVLKATIPLQIVWFSMSFGSGVCGWITKLFEQIGIADVYLQSLYFSLANLPGNAVAAFLVDRVGRKILLFGSMAACALCLGLAADGAVDAEVRQNQIVWSAFAFHAFLVTGWCALSVMTSELFPTTIRGTGMGACSAVGRIAGILVQFVNGALIDKPSTLLIVAGSCMGMGAFAPILFRLPDMANKDLSEVISAPALGVLEGDGQAVHKLVHDDNSNSSMPNNDVDIDPDGTSLAIARNRVVDERDVNKLI